MSGLKMKRPRSYNGILQLSLRFKTTPLHIYQFIGFRRLCTLTLVHRIQIIGHSYIAQMEWPWIVPCEICIYVLYVCYNSENKQQTTTIPSILGPAIDDTTVIFSI